MSFRIGTIAAGMIAVAVSSLHAQPSFDDQPEHSRVSLIAETDAFSPGTTSTIAVVFEIDKGWHTYADSINDSGAPLLVKWALPEGIEIGNAIWPAAHRHVQAGGILDHTFDDRLVVLFPVDVASGVEIGSDALISASLEWLVCDANRCVPQFAEASIELPVQRSNKPGPKASVVQKARSETGKLATGARSDAIILGWEGDTLVVSNVMGYALEFIPGPGCPAPEDLLESGYSDVGRLELAFDFDDHPDSEIVGWVRLVKPEGKRLPPIDTDLYLIRLHRGQGPNRILGGVSSSQTDSAR